MEKQKNFRSANLKRVRLRDQRLARQANYGVSQKEYERMLRVQNGVCAICSIPDYQGLALSIDHDHSTAQNRGLLCRRCNVAIGMLEDDPNLLRRAMEYILRGGPETNQTVN